METLKVGFFPSTCVGGGELCRRVGHLSKMNDHLLKILEIFELKTGLGWKLSNLTCGVPAVACDLPNPDKDLEWRTGKTVT